MYMGSRFGRICAVFTVLQRGGEGRNTRGEDGGWGGKWGREAGRSSPHPSHQKRNLCTFCSEHRGGPSTTPALCSLHPLEPGSMCLGKAGLDQVLCIALLRHNLLVCFLNLQGIEHIDSIKNLIFSGISNNQRQLG